METNKPESNLSELVDAIDDVTETLEKLEKNYMTLDELFSELDKQEKNRFFLFKILDNLIPSFLGYRTSWIIFRPHAVLRELYLRLKWANQRVFREWDDTQMWNVDSSLARIIYKLIEALSRNGHGTFPMWFVPEGFDYQNDYAVKYYSVLYRLELKTISDFFRFYERVQYTGTDEEMKVMREKLPEIFSLLAKHFESLWD